MKKKGKGGNGAGDLSFTHTTVRIKTRNAAIRRNTSSGPQPPKLSTPGPGWKSQGRDSVKNEEKMRKTNI